jgi:hypothetical protein
MGEKEILLKAIIQSISVFAMGVFKIPKGLCKEINDAMSGFRRESTGFFGGKCVYLRTWGAWASVIFMLLT